MGGAVRAEPVSTGLAWSAQLPVLIRDPLTSEIARMMLGPPAFGGDNNGHAPAPGIACRSSRPPASGGDNRHPTASGTGRKHPRVPGFEDDEDQPSKFVAKDPVLHFDRTKNCVGVPNTP